MCVLNPITDQPLHSKEEVKKQERGRKDLESSILWCNYIIYTCCQELIVVTKTKEMLFKDSLNLVLL